jgi:murein DD-endopeptidase MepM/ murein hydrolase activator NlpD
VFVSIGSGGFGAIISSSYLANDADIDNAELAYTEWELDLQEQILNTANEWLGYDEYRFDTDEIGHNPHELLAYLTAVYQNFSYDDIEADLWELFDEQYQLNYTESFLTRYADPYDADGDGNYEPYDWRVLTVSLSAGSFTDAVHGRMTPEQRQAYDILMQTNGDRQYAANVFNFGWQPYITSNYGWRVHPITGASDYHKGIDIGVPTGTDILAAHDGVISVGYDAGGYGHYVTLTGADGLVTKYAHLESVPVSDGQVVTTGDIIAFSGNSGGSTGPHLHFEVIKEGQYLNPLFFAESVDYTGSV